MSLVVSTMITAQLDTEHKTQTTRKAQRVNVLQFGVDATGELQDQD